MPVVSKEDKIYTYKDIQNTPDGEKWEIIDGVIYLQSQPSIAHSECLADLTAQFKTFLRGKTCRVFIEPAVWLDIKPNKSNKNSNKYVAPDLAIICNKDKIKDDGIYGAPDLVVEVLSPSTAVVDLNRKYNLYSKMGVKYYWVVDTHNKTIMVSTLKGNDYEFKIYAEGKVPVELFKGELKIDLAEIFPIR